MNNKIKLLAITGLTFSFIGSLALSSKENPSNAAENKTYYVDFFNNYIREDFTLSNGIEGRGNNLIYQTVQVNANSLVSKPDDPSRNKFEFKGWYLEEEGNTSWNFETDLVTKDTRLFAKWERLTVIDDYSEPEYNPPSTVLEESSDSDYVIDSIMNFTFTGSEVEVSKAAVERLEANKDNVLPLMEYRLKANKNIAATYEDGNITVTCGDLPAKVIQVTDISTKLKISQSNTYKPDLFGSFSEDNLKNYESKAVNYENKVLEENENYHVMLAGSSSIEFWDNSNQMLAPIVSYNHGIGGTTIEFWDECLNQRLVYPYKPKMVVYYVGINNVINSKEDKTVIWNRLHTMMEHTHAALPNSKIIYILMNHLPNYLGFTDTIDYVNEQMIEYQKNNSSWLTLTNPGVELIKENGIPSMAYFRGDGLHLSYYGYSIWGGIIKQSIIEVLESM